MQLGALAFFPCFFFLFAITEWSNEATFENMFRIVMLGSYSIQTNECMESPLVCTEKAANEKHTPIVVGKPWNLAIPGAPLGHLNPAQLASLGKAPVGSAAEVVTAGHPPQI